MISRKNPVSGQAEGTANFCASRGWPPPKPSR
jgi:hypothetical protein